MKMFDSFHILIETVNKIRKNMSNIIIILLLVLIVIIMYVSAVNGFQSVIVFSLRLKCCAYNYNITSFVNDVS